MGGVMGTQIRTVGFIGLGIMGAPMAASLVRAGFDVVGHNRSPARQEALVSAGRAGPRPAPPRRPARPTR